ncbi:F-box protein At2g26850-like [Neltuma alba]|uniref:F-box protein At2g26850-like n=1 Tax=Neltuma alba TaxID=207710 RepID=UPI0010A2EB0B|nr:F-box protein At2g26850-like [Prosopis alba]
MALYVSLQSGQFWFPAQVYKMTPRPRAYDALLSYDHISNTFQARCPTGEWPIIENSITWDRLRSPPVHISPCTLYVSNNNGLKPGDHIEIQSKRGSLTYDWYYGVIGHLQSCDEDHCSCEYSEMLVVSFKLQRRDRSRWESVLLNRQMNGEQKARPWKFGGIRKLENLEDIRSWNAEYHT